jgi:polyferredoxin
MSKESNLPDVTLGDDEPAMARVLLVLSTIGAFALLILHGVLYPGDGIPAFGDIFSMFSELAGSGIWFFLIGIMIGFGMMIATVIGEALED